MEDYEKQRADYVSKLERENEALRGQVNYYRSVEKWVPELSAVQDIKTQTMRITLAVGGKNTTAQVPLTTVVEADTTSITSAVVDAMYKNSLFDSFSNLIEPEVAKLKKNIQATAGAGKW
jgi:hypothetical protein